MQTYHYYHSTTARRCFDVCFTEPAFVLPDTLSKLNQIFPKCAPKRTSNNNSTEDDEFADFSTASPAEGVSNTAFNTQAAAGFSQFAAFSTAEINNTKVNGSKPNEGDDGFSDFADFSSAPDLNKPKADSSFKGFLAFPPPNNSSSTGSANTRLDVNVVIPAPKPSVIEPVVTDSNQDDEFGDFSSMSEALPPASAPGIRYNSGYILVGIWHEIFQRKV